MKSNNLLDGVLVLDMSLFLAGPYAALRLQDLGARVIKVERPVGGDPCRDLYKVNDEVDSTLFTGINRGKESITLNLKDPNDLEIIYQLIKKADVFIQNYRPGVAERLGLGYEDVKKINNGIIYSSVSGYGSEGPWSSLPGQDLLAQARSGIMWLNGNKDDLPIPIGLPLADMYAGANAVQGILAALVKKGRTGEGCLIETSLLEGLIDLQFEMISHYLNDNSQVPIRSAVSNANVYAPAPYGVYVTKDGFLALAMNPLEKLLLIFNLNHLEEYITDPKLALKDRDYIKTEISKVVKSKTNKEWLAILEPEGIWCADVLDWKQLLKEKQLEKLDMFQTVSNSKNDKFQVTKIPIMVNGERPSSKIAAPRLGEHSEKIKEEFCKE